MTFDHWTPEELLRPLNESEQKHAPKELFVAGDRSLLRSGPAVSIVGSREASRSRLRIPEAEHKYNRRWDDKPETWRTAFFENRRRVARKKGRACSDDDASSSNARLPTSARTADPRPALAGG